MDAEKFDKVVLDLLYDELDELTRASAIRHTEQSGRAKALYSELRATRQVGALPLAEPPAGLAERILAAEQLARADRPLRQRLGALVSIAASYAMRPQLGMAAVLLLMVGSSLLFLRAQPGQPSSVQVTERGVPESDRESTALSMPRPEAPGAVDEPLGLARPAPRLRDSLRAEATDDKASNAERRAAPQAFAARDLSAPAAKSEGKAAAAAEPAPARGIGARTPPMPASPLAEADEREAQGSAGEPTGCTAALPKYEAIVANPPSPSEANAARFAAADCYARLGRIERARAAYAALLTVPDYAARARNALAALPAPVEAAPAAPSPPTAPDSP